MPTTTPIIRCALTLDGLYLGIEPYPHPGDGNAVWPVYTDRATPGAWEWGELRCLNPLVPDKELQWVFRWPALPEGRPARVLSLPYSPPTLESRPEHAVGPDERLYADEMADGGRLAYRYRAGQAGPVLINPVLQIVLRPAGG